MKEYGYVRHPLGSPAGEPFDDREQVELAERPTRLMMASINNVGLDISGLLQGLGFVQAEGSCVGDLVLMSTPQKILGLNWALSYAAAQEEEKQNPNIFTIYLNYGPGICYMDFLRQIVNWDGNYCIFFP